MNVGRAAELRIDQEPDGAAGGTPFVIQPTLSLRDMGGNIKTSTKDLLVDPILTMSLALNPRKAKLTSIDVPSLTTTMTNGTFLFTNVSIDVAGAGYSLSFSVSILLVGESIPYFLSVESSPFTVSLGQPSSLGAIKSVDSAVANGLQFFSQPVIAVLDPGGNILSTDSANVVYANLTRKSTSARLEGDTAVQLFHGVAKFMDLGISLPGKAYELTFSCSCDVFATSMVFDVTASAEFAVNPDSGSAGERFGYSTSVFGNIAAIGAPLKGSPILEVQRLTSYGTSTEFSSEVQRVQTKAARRVEIQQLFLCGNPESRATGNNTGKQEVSGFFVLQFEQLYTRPLRTDISAEGLRTVLMSDIPSVGSLTVERIHLPDCSLLGSYQWTIFFDSRVGEVAQLVLLANGLSTYTSPNVSTFGYNGEEYPSVGMEAIGFNLTSGLITVQDSTVLSGHFYLQVEGDAITSEQGHSQMSNPLPVDVSSLELKAELERLFRNDSLPPEYYADIGLVSMQLVSGLPSYVS